MYWITQNTFLIFLVIFLAIVIWPTQARRFKSMVKSQGEFSAALFLTTYMAAISILGVWTEPYFHHWAYEIREGVRQFMSF